MPPRLRVLAGTSSHDLQPITQLVNTPNAHELASDLFEGSVAVNIKGLVDEDGQIRDSEYFAREDRQGITWSIQVRGRFLTPHGADDILFGNTFDRPLKLPWGTSAVLKFMSYIDPTLEHDLTSARPWALSPLISTMPHFSHVRLSNSGASPSPHSSNGKSNARQTSIGVRQKTSGRRLRGLSPFPPARSIGDDTSQIYLTVASEENEDEDSGSTSGSQSSSAALSLSSSCSSTSSSSGSSKESGSASLGAAAHREGSSGGRKIKRAVKAITRRRERRKAPPPELEFKSANERKRYFSGLEHRQSVVFGPEDVITTDFCYGFLEFSPTLALRLPGGLSFDLMRYWDGQSVRFVCCERRSDAEGEGDPWGRIFWCVQIELVDEGDRSGESGDGNGEGAEELEEVD